MCSRERQRTGRERDNEAENSAIMAGCGTVDQGEKFKDNEAMKPKRISPSISRKPAVRATSYTEEKFSGIIARLSKGEPLAQILRDDGMPGMTTFYDWTYKDPVAAERFARARELGFDEIAASTLVIADEEPPRTASGGIDGGAVQHAKLRIETRLKLLAKWDPRRYGEKVEVSGDPNRPLGIAVEFINLPK